MERARVVFARYSEVVIIVILVAATGFAVLLAANKLAFLNFFYIPVLVAAYFLGRRQGVMTAVAAVLMVGVYAAVSPGIFAPKPSESTEVSLVLWGSFVVVAAYVVGTLYESKADALDELKDAYQGILEILAKVIDSAEERSDDHSSRVAALAAKTAIVMDLPIEEIDDVRAAGLLHHIGPADLSLETLRKAASSGGGTSVAGRHSAKGLRFPSPVGGLLRNVVSLVEARDSDYPGAQGDRTPIGARILAVADAYDTMTADPAGAENRSRSEVMAEIDAQVGTRFDPAVVEAFRRVLGDAEASSTS